MLSLSTWPQELVGACEEAAKAPQNICDLCVNTVGMNGAGLSMVTKDGERSIVCATDERSAHIEDLQFMLGEGPCIDAVRTGTPVLIGDLESSPGLVASRWPAFLSECVKLDIKAVFAFPLRVGAISIGALDMYRTSPGNLSDDELTASLLAADAAAMALLDGASADPRAVMSHRHELPTSMQVHQATGMVQAQLGVTTADALLRLRAKAFATGRTLVAVATDVVERHLRFSLEDE